MKKRYNKRSINYKKSISKKKKNKYQFKAKKKSKKLFYVFRMIKFLFLILLIHFHSFCYNHSKKIIDNFYKKRIAYLKGRRIHYNESNLITFTDKINWLTIHDVTNLKTKCADKILLHEYSKRVLKKDICNKILKIYDNADQININELPEQFVLKTNHGSSFNIIVSNRAEFNLENAKKKLTKWLSIDYGKNTREFHYSFIKRKLFAEEYLRKDINDYRLFCFHGIPRYAYVSQKIDNIKYATYFDMNWKQLDYECDYPNHPTAINLKPKNFELMKKYARKLSKPFKFVRVDFYEFNNEVRLGELTFSPRNSFTRCKNRKHEIELGKYLKLF